MSLDTPDVPAIRAALLEWFSANARDLPWRRTRDPYLVLVAEIMLQQTQVDRVIPKYLAFLETFPTLQALAAAPTAEVIRLWSGLGYNRRAVNLQRAARAVHEGHGGQFPRDVEALRRLPGVGPYTAGAVACFAFEQDVAFIDTNIRRVLRRALFGPDDATPAPTERELLAAGHALVPPGQGWAWNQAIMELGALICTAAAPACRRCPLRTDCRAYAAWAAADEELLLAMGGGLDRGGHLDSAARQLRYREGRENYVPEKHEGEWREGAKGRRRVAERKPEAPYAGSRRWFRGRVVEALRALAPGELLPLAELGPQVRPGYAADDEPWLRELVAGLARDGLVALEGDAARLP
jgi:A/G-specific adenine glycosylase